MPAGRPTQYKPEYAKQTFRLCLLGATDASLAEFFEVSEVTINAWKNKHPEFLNAIRRGKEEADSKIAEALYHRAKGYRHPDCKIVADAKTGDEHIVEYTKHYPPDTAAAFIWLKNRAGWRDKQDVEHSGDMQVNVVKFGADSNTAK